MKILVFSDVHGNDLALNELDKHLSQSHYDKIAFLGDIFGYYYEQEFCYKILNKIPNLIWLKGNHDMYAVRAYYEHILEDNLIKSYGHSYSNLRSRFDENEIKRIDSLPLTATIDVDNKHIGFFHGRPSDELEGRVYNDTLLTEDEFSEYNVVFVGHTHCKIDRWVGNTHVISPGSLGQPRDGKGYGFLIYDTDQDSCDFYDLKVDNGLLLKKINQMDRNLKKLQDVLNREIHDEQERLRL